MINVTMGKPPLNLSYSYHIYKEPMDVQYRSKPFTSSKQAVLSYDSISLVTTIN